MTYEGKEKPQFMGIHACTETMHAGVSLLLQGKCKTPSSEKNKTKHQQEHMKLGGEQVGETGRG